MAVGARTVPRLMPRVSPVEREAVDRLARWLLVAVALDLVVTRFIVRLAIFVPKGEPWATVSAALGRVGAATDSLVPIVGLLLLGALLVRAGRVGRRSEQVILVALAVVAAGGLALVHFSPSPAVLLVLDLLVVAVAVGAGIRFRQDSRTPVIIRSGLLALASAVALAGLGRVADVAGVLVGPDAGEPGATAGLVIGTLGQFAFIIGAALLGLGGVVSRRGPGPAGRGLIALGFGAAAVALLGGVLAPATWGALAIWSVGLAGAIPAPAVALALGLAVAGLPALHRRAPASAVGASIVLLSGHGLGASGLVLAALLGLVVARSGDSAGPGGVRP